MHTSRLPRSIRIAITMLLLLVAVAGVAAAFLYLHDAHPAVLGVALLFAYSVALTAVAFWPPFNPDSPAWGLTAAGGLLPAAYGAGLILRPTTEIVSLLPFPPGDNPLGTLSIGLSALLVIVLSLFGVGAIAGAFYGLYRVAAAFVGKASDNESAS